MLGRATNAILICLHLVKRVIDFLPSWEIALVRFFKRLLFLSLAPFKVFRVDTTEVYKALPRSRTLLLELEIQVVHRHHALH